MSKFEIKKTNIDDLVIVQPTVLTDTRGFFLKIYSEKYFDELGILKKIKEENHLKSGRGVLRGLHFQIKKPQGKLVRVVKGRILDVVVDLRKKSKTFGQWYSIELSEENKLMLYVPEGFAHGFLALEDDTEVIYKCTESYYPEYDTGILWNDSNLNIEWELDKYGIKRENLILSEKDKKQKKFDKEEDYFI